MEAINKAIEQANSIVITTHKSPDGDAIGSSLSLQLYLQKLGKDVSVIVPDAFPKFLGWMKGADEIVYFDGQTSKATTLIEKADLIFSLDYNSLDRVGVLGELIGEQDAVKVVIDHHQNPKDFADHYFVDTDCCSTCQLIYELIESFNNLSMIDVPMGECIYCGIMTDTGSFRFPSTTAKTHQIISTIVALGVEGSKIHQYVYDTYSEHRLRLLGYALTEKMKVFTESKAAYISLSSKELKSFNYIKGDTEGLVNYPLSIDGIKMAILLTEKEGEVRLSFRSKDDVYVNELAREHFSGGGHVYAAGGKFDGTLEEALKAVEDIINKV